MYQHEDSLSYPKTNSHNIPIVHTFHMHFKAEGWEDIKISPSVHILTLCCVHVAPGFQVVR